MVLYNFWYYFEVNIVAKHVNAERITIILRFYTEIKQTVLNSWYVKTMSVRRGAKRTFAPLWKLGLRTKFFYKTWRQQFIIDLFLAMTVYFPLWHSHCRRGRFTVLVSCSGELAVRSLPLASFACRGRLPKLRANCSTVGLCCVTIARQQI